MEGMRIEQVIANDNNDDELITDVILLTKDIRNTRNIVRGIDTDSYCGLKGSDPGDSRKPCSASYTRVIAGSLLF